MVYGNSPSSKLVQIEHALTAAGSGQTSLGITASNGVVIATEKKLPSILIDEASVRKIQHLTPNIGVVYRYTEDMELDDAIHTALLTLKESFDGEISSKNIEIGKISADKVFRVLTFSRNRRLLG